jgi:hypothetical protein
MYENCCAILNVDQYMYVFQCQNSGITIEWTPRLSISIVYTFVDTTQCCRCNISVNNQQRKTEAGHILYLRILYPIHIQAPKMDIISYPYPGPKKGYGYILYPLSKILPALSQFLNNKKPDLLALQHTSPRLFTGSN